MSRPLRIAQNLNASDPAVGAAIAQGDAAWVRAVARRIDATGVDFIDCNAGTFGAAESGLLAWLCEQVGAMARAPLSIDSADPRVIERVAAGVPPPTLLNSLPLDVEWTPALRDLLADPRRSVVLSLRRGGALPPDADTRMAWADEGLRALAGVGVGPERVFVDAIALPWGDDLGPGRALLDFVAAFAERGTGARTLVGLGNLGHGHPEAARIEREWWGRLRDAGLGAALVDAFDPGLTADPAPGP